MNFLYKEFTIFEFSVLTIVISVGELRYKFITFSRYPNANGFSAAEVPFDSRIFSDILSKFSSDVRWYNFSNACDATELPDGTDRS